MTTLRNADCGVRNATAAALVALAVTRPQAADDPSATLRRAGEYVRTFERQLAVVIGEEQYSQQDVLPKTTDRRQMRSEVLFTWIGAQNTLLWVRNPLVVDGTPVAGAQDRLQRIARDASADPLTRLRALRRESARFNLGDVYRDFNDPTYALLFLDPAVQPQFDFRAAGHERIDGHESARVTFVERQRPTVIRNGAADVPARGTVWIAADGAVLRTRLQLEVLNETMSTASAHVDQVTQARIDVDYARSAALDMWLPARMTERYVRTLQDGVSPTLERIECTAAYSNFRRFETGGRIIEP